MPGGTEVLERTRVAQVETGKNGRCGTARNHGEFRLDARCDGEHDPEQTCASGLMHSRGAMHRIGWAAALLVAFCAHAHAARATKPDAEVLSACISATLSKAARSSYPSKGDNVVYVLPDEEKYAASLSDDQLRVDLRDPANWSTLRALFQNLRDRAGKGWRPPKNIAVSGFRIKIATPHSGTTSFRHSTTCTTRSTRRVIPRMVDRVSSIRHSVPHPMARVPTANCRCRTGNGSSSIRGFRSTPDSTSVSET